MTGPDLEQRIQRLEDIEAIDLTAIPSIFAADARWESRDMGLAVDGVDAMIADLPRSTSMVEFSMHAFLSPVITLDADTASGSWLMWIASIIDNDPRAVYLSADTTYTRTGQGWRVQTVGIHHGMRLPP